MKLHKHLSFMYEANNTDRHALPLQLTWYPTTLLLQDACQQQTIESNQSILLIKVMLINYYLLTK